MVISNVKKGYAVALLFPVLHGFVDRIVKLYNLNY